MKTHKSVLGSLRDAVNCPHLDAAMAHREFNEAYEAILAELHLPFTHEVKPELRLAYVLTKYEFYVDGETDILYCTDADIAIGDYMWFGGEWIPAD